MPLPIDVLLRVQASPVPTQIVLGVCAYRRHPQTTKQKLLWTGMRRFMDILASKNHFPAGDAFARACVAGSEKCASSRSMFCSTFSTEICVRDALPFCACSMAKG